MQRLGIVLYWNCTRSIWISPGKCPDPTSGRKRGGHAIFVTRWLYSTSTCCTSTVCLCYLPHEHLRRAEHVPARLALVEVQPLYSRKEFGRCQCQCSVSPHPSTLARLVELACGMWPVGVWPKPPAHQRFGYLWGAGYLRLGF